MSYSGNTLAFQAKARGSIPLIRSIPYPVYVSAFRKKVQIEVIYVLCPRFAPDVDT